MRKQFDNSHLQAHKFITFLIPIPTTIIRSTRSHDTWIGNDLCCLRKNKPKTYSKQGQRRKQQNLWVAWEVDELVNCFWKHLNLLKQMKVNPCIIPCTRSSQIPSFYSSLNSEIFFLLDSNLPHSISGTLNLNNFLFDRNLLRHSRRINRDNIAIALRVCCCNKETK